VSLVSKIQFVLVIKISVSGSCTMVGFSISVVEPSGFTTRELVYQNH
jgi:hypothetical protein